MKLARSLLVLPLLVSLSACSYLRSTDPADLPDREKSAEQLYSEAQRAARRGDFDQAVSRMETLQAQYPFGALSRQAELDIIHMYYASDEWDSTIAAADRFIRLNPSHERVDYALYMRASANQARGRYLLTDIFPVDRSLRDPVPLRLAFSDYKRLAEQFPESDYAEDARYRMVVIRNQLANHELSIAQHYLKQEAYVGAANRARAVIENYQETPAVKPALEILVAAYDRLELPELKEDVLRVIRLNYPDHPLARR